MNILVIGGTRFFGKELVSNLLSNGNKITLVSRGNNLLPENENLNHIKGDRSSLASLLDNYQKIIGKRHMTKFVTVVRMQKSPWKLWRAKQKN